MACKKNQRITYDIFFAYDVTTQYDWDEDSGALKDMGKIGWTIINRQFPRKSFQGMKVNK